MFNFLELNRKKLLLRPNLLLRYLRPLTSLTNRLTSILFPESDPRRIFSLLSTDLNPGKNLFSIRCLVSQHNKEYSRKKQIKICFIFSQVPASGPKGLVKGDVMMYILANDLKPIAAKKPEPVEAAKPAPVKADKPAKKPQYEIR